MTRSSGGRTRRGQQYGSFNNQSTLNFPGSPPPPYTFYQVPTPPSSYPSSRYHDADPCETASLLSMNKARRNVKAHFLLFVIPLFFFLIIASVWVIVPVMSAAIDSEMAEWRRVHKEMERDIRRLRVEKGIVLDDLHQLQLQREEQRREWEREREAIEERRHGHVPFWGEARLLTAQCPGDRFRQYDARMYNLLVEDDWYGMCMNTSMNIAGRTLASPRSCINYGLDAGVRGYWSIEVNTRECPRTIWDRLRNIFR